MQAFNQYVDLYNAEHSDEIAAGTLVPLEYSSCDFIVKASGIESHFVVDKQGILDPRRMRPNIPERGDESLSLLGETGVSAAKQALESAGRKAQEIDLVILACSNLQRAYPAIAIEIQQHLDCFGYGYDMNVACSSAAKCSRSYCLWSVA